MRSVEARRRVEGAFCPSPAAASHRRVEGRSRPLPAPARRTRKSRRADHIQRQPLPRLCEVSKQDEGSKELSARRLPLLRIEGSKVEAVHSRHRQGERGSPGALTIFSVSHCHGYAKCRSKTKGRRSFLPVACRCFASKVRRSKPSTPGTGKENAEVQAR